MSCCLPSSEERYRGVDTQVAHLLVLLGDQECGAGWSGADRTNGSTKSIHLVPYRGLLQISTDMFSISVERFCLKADQETSSQ